MEPQQAKDRNVPLSNDPEIAAVSTALAPHAFKCLRILEDAGLEAWFVGGCVRDALLGRERSDVDMACNAVWTVTKRVCEDAGLTVYETGVHHGTLTIIVDGKPVEVTTFRIEEGYTDHRHPDAVKFVGSIEEDLARRDFTINAIAFHPTRGIVDPFGGREDIKAGIIRCVGNAQLRFSEDALRVLRAIRFASQLGFAISEVTENALFRYARDLTMVSGERIKVEVEKMLCGDDVRRVIVDYIDVLGVPMPELMPMKGFDQHARFHIYDVLEHTAVVTASTPPEPLIRWAGLLHDVGKPDTFTLDEEGNGHMYGHQKFSAIHMHSIAKRLHFSRKMEHDLELLILYHDMRPVNSRRDISNLFKRLEYREDLFHQMCNIMRADALGKAEFCHSRVGELDEIEAHFNSLMGQGVCFKLADLPINGADVLAMGVGEGPLVGATLEMTLHAVMDEEIPQTREACLDYANDILIRRARTLRITRAGLRTQ